MKHTFILALLIALGTVVPGFSQTSARFTRVTTGPEGSITLTLTGAVLTTYTILATTNLSMPFSIAGVLVTDESGVGSFTDPGTMMLNRERFYRAQQTVLGGSSPEAPGNSAAKPAMTPPRQTPGLAAPARPSAR